MSKQRLGLLWAVISIVSIIIMLVVQNTTGWELSWIIPMIGVVVAFIVTFVFGKDE